MNAIGRTIDFSSAQVADPEELDTPEAAALRLLAEWFSAADGPPADLAERTVAYCAAGRKAFDAA
ncbi:MAG: hypothetical protein JWM57_305 [Phycisphaerales bacterium]|jgi:hypothetical protein|nr:hypothetical protein [Phycisphaerales bacterium]